MYFFGLNLSLYFCCAMPMTKLFKNWRLKLWNQFVTLKHGQHLKQLSTSVQVGNICATGLRVIKNVQVNTHHSLWITP